VPQTETPPFVPRGQGRSVVIRIGGREERMPSCGECEHSRSALELKNAHNPGSLIADERPRMDA
jgi:hypothetical protein